MKKKGLVLLLCLALVTTLAVNGTFAQELQNALDTAVDFFLEVTGIGSPQKANENDALDVKLTSTNAGVLAPAYYVEEAFAWENISDSARVTQTTYVTNMNSAAAFVRICIAVKNMDVLHVRLSGIPTDYASATNDKGDYTLYTFDYTEKLLTGVSTPEIVFEFALAKETDNNDIARLGNDFVTVQSFAIEADAFVQRDANGNVILNANNASMPMSAQDALRDALGDIKTFNPFN